MQESQQDELTRALLPKDEPETTQPEGSLKHIDTDLDEQQEIEMRNLPSKEGDFLLSPKFRRNSRYGIFGNYVSVGGDKVRPPDLCFCIIASLFIILPSSVVLIYTNIQLFGLVGGILADVAYAGSILNLLRLIYKCAYTEPGVLTAIPSKSGNEIRAHQASKEGIHVEYKREAERQFDGDRLSYFFSDNRFKYAFIVDPNKEAYSLSLCTTCMIMRPPRSFHCSTCGVCIEAQDHHCPWMGTCIGKRNLKYFLGFLLMTSLHAFITAAICVAYFFQVTYKIEDFDHDRYGEKMVGLLSIGVGLYGGVIGLTLLCFFIYSSSLMLDNITSNENLRTRWHAKHQRNQDRRRKRLTGKANEQMDADELEEFSALTEDDKLATERKAGCWQKLTFFFFRQNIPSRLETYLQLKAKEGLRADYTQLDNASVLLSYGIEIPLIKPENSENVQERDAPESEEESKQLLINAQNSD